MIVSLVCIPHLSNFIKRERKQGRKSSLFALREKITPEIFLSKHVDLYLPFFPESVHLRNRITALERGWTVYNSLVYEEILVCNQES